MSDLVREARRNAKNWADKPDSAAMWNRFADRIEQLEAVADAAKAYETERYHDTWLELHTALEALEGGK